MPSPSGQRLQHSCWGLEKGRKICTGRQLCVKEPAELHFVCQPGLIAYDLEFPSAEAFPSPNPNTHQKLFAGLSPYLFPAQHAWTRPVGMAYQWGPPPPPEPFHLWLEDTATASKMVVSSYCSLSAHGIAFWHSSSAVY